MKAPPAQLVKAPAGQDGALEWELWSTTARLVVTDLGKLDAARTVVDRVLHQVEMAASRFRPDGEILHLTAGDDGTIEVSEMLARLLAKALEAAELSDGCVDPTVGDALMAIGYDRDIRLVLKDGAPARAVVNALPDWRALELDGNRLRMPRAARLDLGATAKAVAADECAQAVAETLDTGVLVSLGGDIATAGPGPEGGWQVLVQDGPDEPASRVGLEPGTALATSSTIRRSWRRGEEQVHHIVDPRTGRPAQSTWRTVSVVGRSCFEANTASTCAVVRGDTALAWLAPLGLPARLVHADGSVVTCGGWPREEEAA